MWVWLKRKRGRNFSANTCDCITQPLSWRGLPVGPEQRGGQGWGRRWTLLPVPPPLTLNSPPPQKLAQGGALIPVGQTWPLEHLVERWRKSRRVLDPNHARKQRLSPEWTDKQMAGSWNGRSVIGDSGEQRWWVTSQTRITTLLLCTAVASDYIPVPPESYKILTMCETCFLRT